MDGPWLCGIVQKRSVKVSDGKETEKHVTLFAGNSLFYSVPLTVDEPNPIQGTFKLPLHENPATGGHHVQSVLRNATGQFPSHSPLEFRPTTLAIR